MDLINGLNECLIDDIIDYQSDYELDTNEDQIVDDLLDFVINGYINESDISHTSSSGSDASHVNAIECHLFEESIEKHFSLNQSIHFFAIQLVTSFHTILYPFLLVLQVLDIIENNCDSEERKNIGIYDIINY